MYLKKKKMGVLKRSKTFMKVKKTKTKKGNGTTYFDRLGFCPLSYPWWNHLK